MRGVLNEDTNHETYMRLCLELAERARQLEDVPVGSLVVRDGEVLGNGVESVRLRNDPSAHAELEAVRAACRALGSRDLSGATLYTTAEPCFMCSYAIRQTHVTLVVVGAPVPLVGGVTSAHPILTDAALNRWARLPTVLWGVLESLCAALRHETNGGERNQP